MAWLLLLATGQDLDLGPMIGHAGPTEVRIWARATGPAALTLRIGRKPDLSDGREVGGPKLTEGSDFAGHVVAGELEPATRYHFALRLDGRDALSPPWPSFVTAPSPDARGRTRFAFISCVGDHGRDAAAAWGDLAERTPVDLLLLLGDNHYANTVDPARQRAAYRSHRRPAGWADLVRRTPTYAIWDDHDYGPDNSDGTLPGKEHSLRTFQEWWANPAYGSDGQPGVWHRFSRGNTDFFMLDVRYHRSPNKAAEDGRKTMLGAAQLEWLKKELVLSKAAIKFIASGSEWQTHSTADSWKSFARERDEIFAFIEEKKIGGVILLSGDRHFTAAYQVRGRFIEVTSGPFGSKNYPSKNLPEMFMNHGEGKLYCIFDVETSGDLPSVMLEVYRAGQGLIEKRAFTLEEIDGRKAIPPLPPSPPAPPKK